MFENALAVADVSFLGCEFSDLISAPEKGGAIEKVF